MKRILSKSVTIALILSMLVFAVGIMNLDIASAASKLHVKAKAVSLDAGKTYQQKLINKNGKAIKATKVKWKSAKPSVAKINKKGKITAIKAGTVKMTAKYKGKTYKFTVKVKPLDPRKYQLGDLAALFNYANSMSTCTENIYDDLSSWGYDGYSSYSRYVDRIINGCKKAIPYINQSKAITTSKYPKKCVSQQASSNGYLYLDELYSDALLYCNNVVSTDKSSLSGLSRITAFIDNAVNARKVIAIIYLEVTDTNF